MKTIKTLLLIFSTFALCGCNQEIERHHYEETPEVEVQHDYNEVADYELLWDSMFDVDLNLYYVYIYSITCSHCNDLKNYIIPIALEMKIIFFVKGSSKDQIGNDPNLSKNAENPGDIWILGYPSLLQIKDHKCTKNLAGVNQIKGEIK